MKGLLLKDIFTMRKYIKSLGALCALYLVLGIIGDNPYFFSGFSGLICVMLSISSFSYDAYAKWDKMSACLPLRRKDIVGSKYLLAIIMVAVGAVITFVMRIAYMLFHADANFSEFFSMMLGTAVVAVMIVAFALPFIYKFGVEKGRVVLIISILSIITIISLIGFSTSISLESIESMGKAISAAIAIAAIIGLYVSYRISCAIFENKPL